MANVYNMAAIKPNHKLNSDKKQLAFVPSSLILANYNLPLNRALGEKEIKPLWRTHQLY